MSRLTYKIRRFSDRTKRCSPPHRRSGEHRAGSDPDIELVCELTEQGLIYRPADQVADAELQLPSWAKRRTTPPIRTSEPGRPTRTRSPRQTDRAAGGQKKYPLQERSGGEFVIDERLPRTPSTSAQAATTGRHIWPIWLEAGLG